MTTPVADKLGDFFSVQLGPKLPVPVINGIPGQSVTLANQDLTKNVTISRNNSVAGGATIPPLGSITVDMSKTIWGTAPSGTLPLLVFPGGGQWAPSPAQVAAQISALGLMQDSTGQAINATAGGTTSAVNGVPLGIYGQGVPLANKSTILLNTTGQVIASGGTYAPATIALTQPTAEVLVSAQNGAGDTTAFITLTLQWSDSTSGIVLEPDTYQLACGTGFSIPIHGILVAHGDRLTVTVKNNGSTSCTLNILVLNNSKPTNVDTELWRYLSNAANINNYDVFGAFDVPTNYLMNALPSVAASGTVQRTLPIYIGAPVQLSVHTGSGTTDMIVMVQVCAVISTALGYTDNVIFRTNTNGNGDVFQQIWLPRAQCRVVVTNNNASARNTDINVIGTT